MGITVLADDKDDSCSIGFLNLSTGTFSYFFVLQSIGSGGCFSKDLFGDIGDVLRDFGHQNDAFLRFCIIVCASFNDV
jgi:hypothetical protein